MYELENIRYAHGAKKALDDLTLSFEEGHFYGIIGPNGSGKTTLIDLLAGHQHPHSGSIHLSGRPLERYSRKSLARRIALVPQDYRINFPYTCKEVVMMGRYPHIPRFSRPGDRDRQVVDKVLQQADLGAFTHRYVNQLSGGERQRVVFARSLAQETPILLLDEATANLDMQHTIGLLDLAARRVSTNTLVIAVMQDINLAAMYCDRLVCLQEGRVYANGPLASVLTAETLRAVFNVQARVSYDNFAGTLQVVLKR
ncbi:MAG: ABC transporter ATP-binding protein [Desulfobacteraceae bacterium]|jgi:iron complex transport system ATP-binding protein